MIRCDSAKCPFFFPVLLFILYAFTSKLEQDINNTRCMVMECPELGSLKWKLCAHFLRALLFRMRVYQNSLVWGLMYRHQGRKNDLPQTNDIWEKICGDQIATALEIPKGFMTYTRPQSMVFKMTCSSWSEGEASQQRAKEILPLFLP